MQMKRKYLLSDKQYPGRNFPSRWLYIISTHDASRPLYEMLIKFHFLSHFSLNLLIYVIYNLWISFLANPDRISLNSALSSPVQWKKIFVIHSFLSPKSVISRITMRRYPLSPCSSSGFIMPAAAQIFLQAFLTPAAVLTEGHIRLVSCVFPILCPFRSSKLFQIL